MIPFYVGIVKQNQRYFFDFFIKFAQIQLVSSNPFGQSMQAVSET